jgi:hypothetical protein
MSNSGSSGRRANALAAAGALLAFGAVLGAGCKIGGGGGGTASVDCSPYDSCDTCMPVLGCGWCGVAPGGSNTAGFCTADSYECATQYYPDSCPSSSGNSSGCRLSTDQCQALCADKDGVLYINGSGGTSQGRISCNGESCLMWQGLACCPGSGYTWICSAPGTGPGYCGDDASCSQSLSKVPCYDFPADAIQGQSCAGGCEAEFNVCETDDDCCAGLSCAAGVCMAP